MKRLTFLAFVMLFGCPTSTSKNTQPTDAGEVLAQVSGDLDGDGKDDQVVVAEKWVTAGSAKLAVDYSYEPETDASYTAKVIDIDPSDKMKEVLLEESDGLDGVNYTVFTYDGKSLTKSDLGWSMGGMDIADKMVTMSEENCGQTITKKYARAGAKVSLKDEQTTGEFNDQMCAACPYVFLVNGDGIRLEGEILRSLRGAERRTLQSLPLPHADASKPIVVRLSEHKPEITSLDYVYLTVNGVAVAESSCLMDRSGTWCQADERYEKFQRGESIELRFDVPPSAKDAQVTLWAYGYYETL